MILNVTHNGLSSNFDVNGYAGDFTDDDFRRIAEEVSKLGPGTLANFVVDRMGVDAYDSRIYVRPKVPFGGEF